MKRILTLCAVLALLALTACDGTTAAWAFDGDPRVVDGIEYYFNKAGNYAFVSAFAWDGEGKATLNVPGEVEGAAVFGVGGYYGTGVPVAAAPTRADMTPAFLPPGEVEGGHRVEQVIFTLCIGPGVERVLLSSDCLIREEDGETVCYEPRYYLVCDPGSEIFTSANGRLYRRTDGKEVNIMGLYWDEPTEEENE